MFGPAGYAYVYMIYGFYFCLNVVTDYEDYPSAVLIRAVEPLENVKTMKALRGNPPRDIDIASGPGKLCRGLAIDLSHKGTDLTSPAGPLFVTDRGDRGTRVARSARIGVDYAGPWAARLLRFYLPGHPSVSGPRGAAAKRRT